VPSSANWAWIGKRFWTYNENMVTPEKVWKALLKQKAVESNGLIPRSSRLIIKQTPGKEIQANYYG
jgi:hypothetical protein